MQRSLLQRGRGCDHWSTRELRVCASVYMCVYVCVCVCVCDVCSAVSFNWMWHFNKLISPAALAALSPVWSLAQRSLMSLAYARSRAVLHTPHSTLHTPRLPSAFGVNMINGSSSASQLCFGSFSIIIFFLLLLLSFSPLVFSFFYIPFFICRCQWAALIIADRMAKERVNMNMIVSATVSASASVSASVFQLRRQQHFS